MCEQEKDFSSTERSMNFQGRKVAVADPFPTDQQFPRTSVT